MNSDIIVSWSNLFVDQLSDILMKLFGLGSSVYSISLSACELPCCYMVNQCDDLLHDPHYDKPA